MTMITSTAPADDRPVGPALRRGWARRCPACGEGKMMSGFLKVADQCPECGQELHHHRADDGPAFLTILVVGKLVMAMYVTVFMAFHPEPWVMIALCWTVAGGLAMYLLPRFKGAFVALQWSRRMHGFSDA